MGRDARGQGSGARGRDDGLVVGRAEVFCGVKAERQESFSTGATRSDSTGKGRFDLLSPVAMRRLALRYEGGARAHGDRNWEKGIPVSRCLSAALRHTFQYLAGARDEDHLAAAAWNLCAAMHFQDTQHDDVGKPEVTGAPELEERRR